MAGKLIICPTPIGNLGDMPPRALQALQAADAICAEDTRVTGKLLAALGITGKKIHRLDENVIATKAASIVQRVLDGETIAYCTDAGMPGVSDPGLRLVRVARETGIEIGVLPGPTAFVTAYVASGCQNANLYFGGFFPRKEGAKASLIAALRNLEAALVFYESPHRLVHTLETLKQLLPYREVTVCRELTKLHEEILQGTPEKLVETLKARESIQGEIVLVISGPAEQEAQELQLSIEEDAAARAKQLSQQGMRAKEIAKQIASEFSLSRNQAYDIALSV